MVVFYGHLSGEGFKCFRRKQLFLMFIYLIIVGTFSLLAFFFMPQTDFGLKQFFVVIPIVAGLPISLFPLILTKEMLPTRIEVSNDILVCYFASGKHIIGEMDNVKRVEKYKEYYNIQFYIPHQAMAYICQKDLLVEGSLEEFEELFADRIVSKE